MPVGQNSIGRWWVEGHNFGMDDDSEFSPQNKRRYRSRTEALLLRVDDHFYETSEAYEEWDNPHRNIAPSEEEYSRVTNPDRFRIVTARALAWERALSGYEGATVRRPKSDLNWIVGPRFKIDRSSIIYPQRRGSMPLVFGFSVSSAELDADTCSVGAGSPPFLLGKIPDCACDACDSGSETLIERLDKWVLSVVDGSLIIEVSSGVLKLSTEFGTEESHTGELIGYSGELEAVAWANR